MSLPPLKSLPVFTTVARLKSFSKAAAELNITQSAISHQIKQLEDYLGESLFLRHGRKLEITREGQLYLDNISTALSQIARASDQLKGHQQTHIRLSVYSSFAVYWLIPRLTDLKRCYPQLELSIKMSHGTPELSDREADCFITVEKDKRGFSFDALYHEKLFPVCSRSFWAKMKADLAIDNDIDMKAYLQRCPEWLANYPLITSFSIYEQYTEDWRLWFLNQSKKLPEQAKFHNFSHLMLAYEAAKYHQGIALVNDYMVNKYNFDIELIKLPCSSYDTGDQFSFGYKTSRRGELAIQQLRQWIRQQSLSLQEL